MMNYFSLSTSVFTPGTVPATLSYQYGQMRYKCFTKDDPNVNMNHDNETEFDHFDSDEQTRYIMVYVHNNGQPQELMSALRLRPTLLDYELEMPSYLYLTENISLPKDSKVYEGNRWVGKSSRTSEGMLSTAMLISKLYHLSHELSFNEIIGTISTLSENWLGKRSAKSERSCAAYHSERDKLDILVSRIKVDESFLEAGNMLLQSALKEINFEQIMFAKPAFKQAA